MVEIDCLGVRCPLPIVRLSQGVKALSPGDELSIVADDAAFRADLDAWLNKTGNELISIEGEAGRVRATIRKR